MSAPLRKVIVYQYTNSYGEPLVKGELGTGLFHQFGYDCMEEDNGFSSYSIAIVEMPDGSDWLCTMFFMRGLKMNVTLNKVLCFMWGHQNSDSSLDKGVG